MLNFGVLFLLSITIEFIFSKQYLLKPWSVQNILLHKCTLSQYKYRYLKTGSYMVTAWQTYTINNCCNLVIFTTLNLICKLWICQHKHEIINLSWSEYTPNASSMHLINTVVWLSNNTWLRFSCSLSMKWDAFIYCISFVSRYLLLIVIIG